MKKVLSLFILILTLAAAVMAGSECVFASNYNLEAIRLYNIGLEQYRKGAYSTAIDYFKEAIEIQNDFYDAYYNLAVVYDYLGNSASAIAALDVLLKSQPEDFAATYKLAQIYFKKGDSTKSAELLSKIPPTSQEFNKAQSLMNRIGLEKKAQNEFGVTEQTAAKVVPIMKNISGINSPTGIAADFNGNLYVASFSDSAIFKVMPNGIHQLYSKSSMISGPIGMAFDSRGNLYVANYNKNNVLKIDKYGNVSVFVEYSNKPYSVYVKDNVLYVSEQGTNTVLVRKL